MCSHKYGKNFACLKTEKLKEMAKYIDEPEVNDKNIRDNIFSGNCLTTVPSEVHYEERKSSFECKVYHHEPRF